jgi:GNAT superfamily N-acetyltransferase
MIRLKSLILEKYDDAVIEKFISLLPKYNLEYHSPQESEHAFKWRGNIYPTITDKEKIVKVALDRTDIFSREGNVWVGDPSRPMLNGYVIQAIVTDPEHRGKGKASDILRRMIKAADEAGLKLKLEPVPMKDFIKKKEKKLTQPQLQKWYSKHGFEKDKGANIMVRNPKSLSEIEYPMAGEKDQKAYAGYAGYKGKIVWMSPDKFLHLAPPLHDPNLNKLKYVEDRIKKGQPIDFLVLWVDVDRNRVISHEGRHRATVAKKLGVEKIPVLIIVYSHQNYDSYPRVPQWTPRQHDYADKAEFVPQSNKLEEIINHFRGWISPNGEEFNTDDGGTHDSHANQLLRKFYPNWHWESVKQFQSGGAVFAEAALLYKGWIRVVDNGIYSVYKITPTIKSTLIELISDLPDKHKVRLDVEVGSRKTWSSTAKEVLDWLLND